MISGISILGNSYCRWPLFSAAQAFGSLYSQHMNVHAVKGITHTEDLVQTIKIRGAAKTNNPVAEGHEEADCKTTRIYKSQRVRCMQNAYCGDERPD